MKKAKSKKTIIDVRRPDEFAKGHADGSINIPLQEMPERLDEIRKIKSPVVVVCGGGTRHVKAFELLKANGIESEKGGGWKDVNTGSFPSNL
ncbi:MAG TPA: rhodanese-like domain-containing protein [Hanamia sp.]|nr:rhodanese-like domain-containing protein [Hanamia sp.]